MANNVPPKPAELSISDMQKAIPKIQRRLLDLEQFDINSVTEKGNPHICTLSKKLDALLVSIFSFGTLEYNRYYSAVTNIDSSRIFTGRPTSINRIRDGVRNGIEPSKATLKSIIEGFKEEIEDFEASESEIISALKAYEGLELHPEVNRASGDLFKDGHYANAIEDGVKALNALVRLRSGIDNLDGTKLMQNVFSPKSPVLKFNELVDESDKSEQQGFMMMFSGAVAGLRNPRAHRLMKDDPERALEFIAYVSLLAKLVDETERVRP